MADDPIAHTVQTPEPPPSAVVAEELDLFLTDGRERYTLGKALGAGGMATVYEAHDRNLDRTVAVKVLKPKHATNVVVREQFFNEAKILSRLHHPGIIAVHDTGTLGRDQYYYAMEKVDGITLADLLKKREECNVCCPHSTAHLIDIFDKICQTVALAHSEGIIHRDIKPDNIMVAKYGAVLVMDWGLSKDIGAEEDTRLDVTREGVIKGTPAHMSPEQAKGHVSDIDYRTDIFALGILLYELLTDKKPFAGKTLSQLLESILFHEPIPPRKVKRGVSRELDAICMRALAKDPALRYETAESLSEDVRAYREFRPVSARREGPVIRTVKWGRRHPLVTTAACTVLMVGLVMGIVHQVKERHEQQVVTEAMTHARELDDQLKSVRDEIAKLRANGGDPDKIESLRTEAFMMGRKLRLSLAFIYGWTHKTPSADGAEMYRRVVNEELEELVTSGQVGPARALLNEIERQRSSEDNACWTELHINELHTKAKSLGLMPSTKPTTIPIPSRH